MKLSISNEEWNSKYTKLHKWVAWFPVKLECGSIVWLETVMRRKQCRESFRWCYSKLD